MCCAFNVINKLQKICSQKPFKILMIATLQVVSGNQEGITPDAETKMFDNYSSIVPLLSPCCPLFYLPLPFFLLSPSYLWVPLFLRLPSHLENIQPLLYYNITIVRCKPLNKLL